VSTIKLFEVTDTWYVRGRGVELVYDSPLAASARTKPVHDKVTIGQPDQTRQEYEATISAVHISMVDASGKFAFVVLLPRAAPDSIPRGSQVYGSEAAAALLLGHE
jgi:hypothetical protein